MEVPSGTISLKSNPTIKAENLKFSFTVPSKIQGKYCSVKDGSTVTSERLICFYFETEILDYECEKKGYKRLYTPEIKVLHHQNVATNQVYSNLVEKTIFSNKCNFESSSYFLELMGKER